MNLENDSKCNLQKDHSKEKKQNLKQKFRNRAIKPTGRQSIWKKGKKIRILLQKKFKNIKGENNKNINLKINPKSHFPKSILKNQNKNNKSQISKSKIQEKLKQPTILENFVCSICKFVLINSVTTKCGHIFCEQCLFEYLMYFRKCPSCSLVLRHSKDFGSSKIIDNIVEEMVNTLGPNEIKEEYRQRMKGAKNWKMEKSINNPKIGCQLDVQTKEYIWMVGTVKKIMVKNHGKIFYIIQYKVSQILFISNRSI